MRWILSGAGAIAALVLVAISATLCYGFAATLGGTAVESQVYAVAGASIDILKALAPFFFFWRVREKRWLGAGAAALLFSLGVVWSFTSAMGLAAQNRLGRAGVVESRQTLFAEAKQELARLETAQARISRTRSSAEIEAEIGKRLGTAIRLGRKTTTIAVLTEGCMRPSPGTRETCSIIGALREDFARAREWERLEAEATELRRKIERLRRDGAGEHVRPDVQASFLAELTSRATGWAVTVGEMQLGLVVLLAFVLEVGSSCGLYAALGSHGMPGIAAPAAAKTRERRAAGEVVTFCLNRLMPAAGSKLRFTQAFADYGRWCKERGLRPLPRKMFLRDLRTVARTHGLSVSGGAIHHVTLGDPEPQAMAEAAE